MINDIRIALRGLTRVPGFAVAFILTLGLGIGANTAIFSVINGVLLRPLPYPEADRIMHLRQPQVAAGVEDSSFSFPEVADYRRQSKTIDQFVEFGDWTFSVLGRGEPHRADGRSGDRELLPDARRAAAARTDARARRRQVKSAPPVAVLTYGYWQRVFGSDPSVVGQTLDLTVKKAEIVGVLKPGAHYATQRKQDFYVNYAANDHYMSSSMQNEWPHRMTTVYARLAPGATRRERAGGAADDRRCAPSGASRGLPEIARLRHRRHAVEGRADGEGEADAGDSAGHDGVRPGDRVRQRREPHADAARAARTRDGHPRGARRSSVAAAASAARRKPRAVGRSAALLGLGFAVSGLNLLIAYTSRFTSRIGEIGLDWRVLALHARRRDRRWRCCSRGRRGCTFMNDPVRAMAAGGGRTTRRPSDAGARSACSSSASWRRRSCCSSARAC